LSFKILLEKLDANLSFFLSDSAFPSKQPNLFSLSLKLVIFLGYISKWTIHSYIKGTMFSHQYLDFISFYSSETFLD
jgi:hypothetical protein